MSRDYVGMFELSINYLHTVRLLRRHNSFLSFISVFYFSLDPNVSLKQQKKSTFLCIRESLICEKFYFGRFAKVYAREMQKFREFFGCRKFLLAKVSAPKVIELKGEVRLF